MEGARAPSAPDAYACFSVSDRNTMSFVGSVLVIVVTSTVADALWVPPNCPVNCICSGADNTHLWVDCQGRLGRAEELSEQLDSLLSINLTTLTIINTPLTHVPRSVCRLTKLTHLRLDNSRLTRLPDNCLSNLTDLTKLKAIQNNITEIQDGLLNGLRYLQTVVLRQNQIVSVNSRAFTNSCSLRFIDLSNNLLQDLDKRWVYELGSNGDADSPAQINLQYNRISKATNVDGLQLHCGMKRMYVVVDLRYNEIRQLSEAVRAWQLTGRQMLCIAPFVMGRSTVQLYIGHNPFLCDCKDFWLYKMDNNFHFFRLFEGARCSQPLSLRDLEIDQVPLDQFVCELVERCPLRCRCVYRPANATLHVSCSKTNLSVLLRELPKLPNNYTTYKLDFSSIHDFDSSRDENISTEHQLLTSAIAD